jgi:hypothetical protein
MLDLSTELSSWRKSNARVDLIVMVRTRRITGRKSKKGPPKIPDPELRVTST